MASGGGRDVTNARIAQLEQIGEEEVFGGYLEHRTLKDYLRTIWTPQDAANGQPGKDISTNAFWKWLRKVEGRWERWDETKRLKTHMIVEDDRDRVEHTSIEEVKRTKLQVDFNRWYAERNNPKEFGEEKTAEQAIGSVIMSLAKAMESAAFKALPETIKGQVLPVDAGEDTDQDTGARVILDAEILHEDTEPDDA